MKIHKIQLNSFIDIGKINLCIGNFDGFHLGHQKIIKILIKESNILKIDSALMSFIPHPRKFFSGLHNNFDIISDDHKIKFLQDIGIKHYILLNFDQSLASLTPEDFIEKILVEKLNILNLFIGNDFKFGKNRQGNVKLLKEKSLIYNFNVNVIEQVKSKKSSEVLSSSLVRKNIQEGKFKNVSSILGRNWCMDGKVVPGDKRASKMNFPTANIIPPDLIYPKKGVYIVKGLYKGDIYNGIANFGERPTVRGKKLLLEVHLFNFSKNIYGKNLTVEFLAFIRDEKKFENFDKLIQQIRKDIQVAKNYHLNN